MKTICIKDPDLKGFIRVPNSNVPSDYVDSSSDVMTCQYAIKTSSIWSIATYEMGSKSYVRFSYGTDKGDNIVLLEWSLNEFIQLMIDSEK